MLRVWTAFLMMKILWHSPTKVLTYITFISFEFARNAGSSFYESLMPAALRNPPQKKANAKGCGRTTAWMARLGP